MKVRLYIQIVGIVTGLIVYFGMTSISQASSCALTANNIEICLPYGQGSGRYFPNGAIIKSNASPKVYYLENFTKRPIESPALLESRFDWRGLIVTSQEAINEIPTGSDLTFRDGSLLSNRGSVYIISDGLRRPIANPEAFIRLGFKWGNVKAVSDAEINLHGMGEVVTTSSNYPDGVVIKTPGGAMYLVDDNQRRYIPSPLIFESMFRWEEAVDLNRAVAPTYNPSPKGDVYYPNGMLISGNGTVWVMENNKKVPIHSPEIFESLGLSWRMVRPATSFEMSIIPTNETGQIGKNIKFYPDGTLVKADDSAQVYVFEKGRLRPINSPAIFFSYGYTFDKVITFPRRVIRQYTIAEAVPMYSTPTIPAPITPNISVNVSPSSTAEDGSGNLVYTFTRSVASSNALTVNYTVSGTATNGTDYTGISAGGGTKTVTIPSNQTTVTVTVNPNTDSDIEPNETVILTLASGTGYTLGAPNTATGTINNDDVAIPTVSISVSPSSTAEDGSGNLVYTFTRSAASSNALTVNYTVSGTATNGTDYTGISAGGGTKTVIIAANQTTATVTVDPTVDSDVELDEVIILTLASGTGYTLGSPNVATGTISNDDVQAAMLPDPTLYLPLTSDLLDDSSNAFTNVSSNSPTIISTTTPIGTNTGSFAGGAWLEFADHPLLNPGTEDFFVTAYIRGGSSPTGVFPSWFGKGSYQSSTGAFNAYLDRVFDRMGTGASNPWRASELLVPTGSATPAGIWRRIIVQRVGSTVTLYQDNVAMGTYDASNLDLTSTHPFMIGRDLGSDRWDYEITDFAYVKGQSLDNTQRTYLQTNSYADGLNTQVGFPNISISVSPNSVAEDGSGNLVYTFTRSVVDSSALTINYTVGGTAINGTDYTGISAGGGTKTITIAANQATATVTVDPTTDSNTESDETVIVTLSSGTGYTLGSPNVAIGTILNVGGTISSSDLNLPRIAWWGGPSYYSQFPLANAAGWDEPNFFPISVFLSPSYQAQLLKDAGINTYQGIEANGSITDATNIGMFVLPQISEWTVEEVGNNPLAVGWHVSDECEMGYAGCGDANDQYQRLAVQQGYVADVRARNDGRFAQANFGNGVLGTFWGPDTMDDHVALMDMVAVDKYAYTSPQVRFEFGRSGAWGRGEAAAESSRAYGWQVDRMHNYSNPVASKPVWPFIEVGRPLLTEEGARAITMDELEGAVWNSIIHGAAGISYFQQNNNGGGESFYALDVPFRRERVTAVNAKVQSLAPVLNTQSYQWNFGPGLDTMLKTHEGYAYIFAMPLADPGPQASGSRTLTLPPGINGTTVEVIGENRSLTVTGNTFTDTFSAEYEHHVYRIPL